MTATETETPARPGRRRQRFGNHVAGVVSALQRQYLKKSSWAVAAMANLRAAAGSEPGSHYAILDLTSVPEEHLPAYLGDEFTPQELAKHTALTLYAIHQQSNYTKSMHRDGFGLGSAVNRLANESHSAEAVRRRFAVLGTSTTYEETSTHLRTLVRQLRDAQIGLDYGLLADDLVVLQCLDGHERVRARWGRDFHRMSPPAHATDAAENTKE